VTWTQLIGGIRPDAFTMERPFKARKERKDTDTAREEQTSASDN
jgi:hypothetical protein